MRQERIIHNLGKDMLSSENCNKSKFVYCSLRKCPHKTCLRHTINTPFNVLVTMKKFNPDTEWNCKDLLEE